MPDLHFLFRRGRVLGVSHRRRDNTLIQPHFSGRHSEVVHDEHIRLGEIPGGSLRRLNGSTRASHRDPGATPSSRADSAPARTVRRNMATPFPWLTYPYPGERMVWIGADVFHWTLVQFTHLLCTAGPAVCDGVALDRGRSFASSASTFRYAAPMPLTSSSDDRFATGSVAVLLLRKDDRVRRRALVDQEESDLNDRRR